MEVCKIRATDKDFKHHCRARMTHLEKGIKTKAAKTVALVVSGYCDSNTGPSGPKPDALANCATPRKRSLL